MRSESTRRTESIQEMVRAFEYATRERRRAGGPAPGRVIAISRHLGTGGRLIAETLSGHLRWPLWDREILDVLASESHLGYSARMFEALDERARGDIESLMMSVMGEVGKHIYLYLLPRAILTIAQHDAIILGRGAHLYLPHSLRVHVTASFPTRVRNLVEHEGLSEQAARDRIREADREREAFLDAVRGQMPSSRRPQSGERPEYDLIVNVDGFSIDGAASVIGTAAAKMFKLEVGPQ